MLIWLERYQQVCRRSVALQVESQRALWHAVAGDVARGARDDHVDTDVFTSVKRLRVLTAPQVTQGFTMSVQKLMLAVYK